MTFSNSWHVYRVHEQIGETKSINSIKFESVKNHLFFFFNVASYLLLLNEL